MKNFTKLIITLTYDSKNKYNMQAMNIESQAGRSIKCVVVLNHVLLSIFFDASLKAHISILLKQLIILLYLC